MTKLRKIAWTSEHKVWLGENIKGVSRKDLFAQFCGHFSDVPAGATLDNFVSLIKRLGLSNGRATAFGKGHKPWNKGTKGVMQPNSGNFKKGQRPLNYRPVGSERICPADGYRLIKVSDKPPRWRHKHVVMWEKANGKEVPDGWRLKLLDNDRANPTLGNILCVPKAISPLVNRWNPADTEDPEINRAICLSETLKYLSR